MSAHRALLAALLVWCLAACADEGGDGAAAEPTPTASETSVEPSTPPSPTGETPTGPTALAVADLAAHLGVDADAVEVVAVEEVTWRNGSLGCAEPGMMYTQSLVEGSRITLAAGGTSYEYHSSRSGPPFLCERPTQ